MPGTPPPGPGAEKGFDPGNPVPAGSPSAEILRIEGDGACRILHTIEVPVRHSGETLTRRIVHHRKGDVTRSGVRPSMLAATAVVALVLAVEGAIQGTDAA